jgi:hypothetical protein
MTGLVDDTVLGTFAVVGEPAAAGAEIARRYGDLVDRFTLYTPYALDEESRATVVSAIRAGATEDRQRRDRRRRTGAQAAGHTICS